LRQIVIPPLPKTFASKTGESGYGLKTAAAGFQFRIAADRV
jgi:hypothetical protein